MRYSSGRSFIDNGFSIDAERLRKDLIDELNVAAYVVCPAIFEEVSEIERASAAELIEKALEMGLDIHKYTK